MFIVPGDFGKQGEYLGPLNTDGYFHCYRECVRALHSHHMTVPGVSQDSLPTRLPVFATVATYSNFSLSDLFGLLLCMIDRGTLLSLWLSISLELLSLITWQWTLSPLILPQWELTCFLPHPGIYSFFRHVLYVFCARF